jgi:hypothetical protein
MGAGNRPNKAGARTASHASSGRCREGVRIVICDRAPLLHAGPAPSGILSRIIPEHEAQNRGGQGDQPSARRPTALRGSCAERLDRPYPAYAVCAKPWLDFVTTPCATFSRRSRDRSLPWSSLVSRHATTLSSRENSHGAQDQAVQHRVQSGGSYGGPDPHTRAAAAGAPRSPDDSTMAGPASGWGCWRNR